MKVLKWIAVALVGMCILVYWAGGESGGRALTTTSGLAIGATLKTTSDCPSMPTREGWDTVRHDMQQGDSMGATRALVNGGGRFVKAKTSLMVKDLGFVDAVEATDQTIGEHMGERLFLSQGCFQ